MIRVINKAKLLLLVVLCFILSGCPHIYFPYFRNYSNKPVELIFKMSDYDRSQIKAVMYKQEIIAINKRTYKHLKDSLRVVMLPHNYASLTIPANSTILFPKWGTYANKIILKQENNIDSISIWGNDTLNKHFQMKKYGFPVSFLYYYDYK